MISTAVREKTVTRSAAAPLSPRKTCHCCGDPVAPGPSRIVQHRLCCRECHLELVFGIIPEPASRTQEVRSAALLADRQYHGDQFHSAEW